MRASWFGLQVLAILDSVRIREAGLNACDPLCDIRLEARNYVKAGELAVYSRFRHICGRTCCCCDGFCFTHVPARCSAAPGSRCTMRGSPSLVRPATCLLLIHANTRLVLISRAIMTLEVLHRLGIVHGGPAHIEVRRPFSSNSLLLLQSLLLFHLLGITSYHGLCFDHLLLLWMLIVPLTRTGNAGDYSEGHPAHGRDALPLPVLHLHRCGIFAHPRQALINSNMRREHSASSSIAIPWGISFLRGHMPV